ncbi:MAG: hypothetical protein GZ088_16875 [Acidipila sp.]|nr:hypothetical protein [Acidipila sp.]
MMQMPGGAVLNLSRRNLISSWYIFVLGLLLFVPAATCLLAAPPATQENKFPKASEIVRPQVSVPGSPVKRGSTFTVLVKVEVRQGFHIQANKVLEDYLIPTTVEAELPKGLKLAGTSYPQAQLVKFPFNAKKMAVYEGTVELALKLEAGAVAPLGRMILPMSLRYQACSDAACLPPVRLPLLATFNIVQAH